MGEKSFTAANGRSRSHSRSGRDKLAYAAALALLAGWAVYAFAHLSPWAASWDEVDFALALDRFDLLAMQPHAPGYPYFILGGRLMRAFLDNPAQALAMWNLALTITSAYPVFALARRRLGAPHLAALAAAIVLALPMNATLATGAMSEGAALALLWWYLWALTVAAERRTTLAWTAASFAFGLLMGTRLSYAPFGLGLLLLWLAEAAGTRNGSGRMAPGGRGAAIGRAVGWPLIAAAFQLLWLAGLAVAEGGFAGMLSLIEAFAAGHFSEWGGGVATVAMPFGDRLLLFAGDNVLWTGAFARLPALLALTALLLGAAVVQRGLEPPSAPDGFRSRLSIRRLVSPAALLALPAFAYGAWALLGQNIAKPRHAAPLAALLAFALAMFALRACARRPRGALQLAAALLAVALAAAETTAAAQLVARQAEQKPAVYQLADYLRARAPEHAIVYTWEEERVLNYLSVQTEARPIFTYAYFVAETEAVPNARILLTDSVLRGFRAQADIPDSRVKKLATFRSDSRLDPVYGTLVLYEWVR